MLLLRDRELGMRKSEIMEWELRHSAGPPSASCFGIFLTCVNGRERRGQTAVGPTAPNYIRAKATSVKRRKMQLPFRRPCSPSVRRAERAAVSSARENLIRFQGCRLWLGPSEKRSGRRQFLRFWVGSSRPEQRIYKDLAGKSVWNADCSIQGCSSLAPLRGAERRTSSGD